MQVAVEQAAVEKETKKELPPFTDAYWNPYRDEMREYNNVMAQLPNTVEELKEEYWKCYKGNISGLSKRITDEIANEIEDLAHDIINICDRFRERGSM